MLPEFETRMLSLPEREVEIALHDWGGDGPPALLHHANGFCAALFGLLVPKLLPHFRVIGMDARGHGDSSRPPQSSDYHWHHFVEDLLAVGARVVEELECARIELAIGHSFGGTCMAIAASRRPALFGRVAMLDPVIIPPEGWTAQPGFPGPRPEMAALARKRRAVWPSREAVRAAWSSPQHAFGDWDPRALEIYVREGFRERTDDQVELKCTPWVEAAVFDHNHSLPPFDFAPDMTVPTLILWAARGRFPRPIFEELAARMRDARVEDVDGGHLLPMQAPDPTAEAILRFALPERRSGG